MLNLNTPNKQWNMYLNTLSSISGDDLTIKPDTRRNLLLEVSGNNNIIIKRGNVSYNLTNLITGDTSFSNFDISNNINPVTNNNGSLGTSSKLWGNAYIRDISVTNMSVSGTISTFREIIPQITNDISTSLGNSSNMWQKAFIRDLSGITRINSTNWPIIGPTGATGQRGPSGTTPGGPGPSGTTPGGPGPPGPDGTASWNDISNLTLTTKNRIYQEISGGINDLSWAAVNGYYGLAKDAYPSLNPLSSGVKAVRSWNVITQNIQNNNWQSVCWSPELMLFVAVSYNGNNKVMTSPDGITWTMRSNGIELNNWTRVCWSPQLKVFVAVAENGTNQVMYSYDGITWTPRPSSSNSIWYALCWSPELRIFLAVSYFGQTMTSINGIDWISGYETGFITTDACWSAELGIFVAVSQNSQASQPIATSKNGVTWTLVSAPAANWNRVCWSAELGIFVAFASNFGGSTNYVMTSNNGTIWNTRSLPVFDFWEALSWSPDLRIFIAIGGEYSYVICSHNGINWITVSNGVVGRTLSLCWSPELGIFVGVGSYVKISSLKGRPPTSYNVFDSSFNRIDENGKWDFSNINVTTLTVNNGPHIISDDRLKHNEVNINNGLDVIDQLSPKFYKKTQVLLDASYNGDLSGYAWTLEAGLIAQELLQINDLSFTVGGGDYYEQTYKYITQINDLSNSYYDLSNSYYDLSKTNYDLSNSYYDLSNSYYYLSNANYEISNNLIAQPYNVNYNSIFVYGLAAIKELHTKVKAQEISVLDEQLNDLVTRVEALESNRQDMSKNSV